VDKARYLVEALARGSVCSSGLPILCHREGVIAVRSIRDGWHLFTVHDDERPRRSEADEIAEIRDREAEVQAAAEPRWIPPVMAPDLPLSEVVSRMEADEDAAFQARERAEMPEEAEESARILGVERNIAADIAISRARELQRTFGRAGGRAYAAAAVD
jgi:hypothetical protein